MVKLERYWATGSSHVHKRVFKVQQTAKVKNAVVGPVKEQPLLEWLENKAALLLIFFFSKWIMHLNHLQDENKKAEQSMPRPDSYRLWFNKQLGCGLPAWIYFLSSTCSDVQPGLRRSGVVRGRRERVEKWGSDRPDGEGKGMHIMHIESNNFPIFRVLFVTTQKNRNSRHCAWEQGKGPVSAL